MAWHVQDGPTRMNQCLNEPQDNLASSKAIVTEGAINKGFSINMRFFEIYKVDILDLDLADVFSNLHGVLFNQIEQNCNTTTSAEKIQNNTPTLFPNPSNGDFIITTHKKIEKIEIYNLTGVLIAEKNCCKEKTIHFNLTHLPNALYFVNIMDANGIKTISRYIKE